MKNPRRFGRTLAFLMMLLACPGAASPRIANVKQQIVKTPNIDRLAAEGMRFTQFYAGSTVCFNF